MKIAFVSYEYPPDTHDGGIATYVWQAARILAARGHLVEVFAGSRTRTSTENEERVRVHRIREEDPFRFWDVAGRAFAKRHSQEAFDVLEGPDLHAEARGAAKLVPEVALVVKLHSSSKLLWRQNLRLPHPPPLIQRILLGTEARLLGFRPFWGHRLQETAVPSQSLLAEEERERAHALDADEISAPSQSIRRIMIDEWALDESRVRWLPYPYVPSQDLLDIPSESHTHRVTFIGRLEIRKGVLNLARAIPIVLRHHPQTRFRFVGSTDSSPLGDSRRYLEDFLLRRHRNAVEFTGSVPVSNIPKYLAETDICVFPSIWDNFPSVCLEAMAAARGVVATDNGGMMEMLDHGRVGRLVPPGDSSAIAAAVIDLLNAPKQRIVLGAEARERLLTEYSPERIAALQEESYARAIEHRRQVGPRALAT